MTREAATAFVQLNAAVDVTPTLTTDEVSACLDRSRVVDSAGRPITDPEYVETIWATRAVVLAFDAKVAKASTSIDVSADGTGLSRSQLTANLERLRASWRARSVPGSE